MIGQANTRPTTLNELRCQNLSSISTTEKMYFRGFRIFSFLELNKSSSLQREKVKQKKSENCSMLRAGICVEEITLSNICKISTRDMDDISMKFFLDLLANKLF
jgi:hypothetical protein